MIRLTSSIACLLLLTSALLVSASDNPFARWEKLRSETESAVQAAEEVKPEPQATKTTLNAVPSVFFPGDTSSIQSSTTGSADFSLVQQSKPATKERMRIADSMKPVPSESQSGIQLLRASATDASEGVIQQVDSELFEFLGEPVTIDGPNGEPFEPAAGRSEFTSNGTVGHVAVPTIPVTDQPAVADDVNPFAEFLARQELAANAGVKQPSEFDSSEFNSSEFNGTMPFNTNSTANEVPDFDSMDFEEPRLEEQENDPFRMASVSSVTAAPSSFQADPSTGPQQSRVTVEWVRRDEFNVGQPSQCELLVRNDGSRPVRSAEIEVVLPDSVQVTSAVPAPSSTSSSAKWILNELAAGAQKSIELTVIPRQQGDVRMDAFVRTTTAAASVVSVTQPMLAVKVNGPETVELGQQVHYTVTVRNPGTGRVSNVLIQAAIPDGLQHRRGKLLNIDVGTLNPGEQRQARLSVTGVVGGDRELAIRAVGDGGLQEEATAKVVVAEPKLRIGIRGPKIQQAGEAGQFELVVVNEGQADSNNVRTRFQLPEGFEYVSASAGGNFNREDSTIEWFVGTLSPKAALRLQVALKATKTGKADHKVGVISEQGKISTATHQTDVKGHAKLKLKLASSSKSASVGDELVYKLAINNVGQAAAKNVGLSFEVPPGVDLVDVSGPSEYIADNGVVIFRSLDEISNGKSVTFTIRTRCTRSGEHQVRARVASQSIQRAIIAEDTTVAR